MMASPFHDLRNAFLEELLTEPGDVLVFGGTQLAMATGGRIVPLVHGVSKARLRGGHRAPAVRKQLDIDGNAPKSMEILHFSVSQVKILDEKG